MFELLTVVTILSPDSLKKRSFETWRLMLCIFFISHNLRENDWKQISIKMWKHQVFTTLCDAMTSMNGDCSSALFCRLLIQWLIMTPRQSYFLLLINVRPETLQFDGLSANIVFNLYIKDSQTLKESNYNHISWESCYIIELLEIVSESNMIKL